jgi:hypothetical protein
MECTSRCMVFVGPTTFLRLITSLTNRCPDEAPRAATEMASIGSAPGGNPAPSGRPVPHWGSQRHTSARAGGRYSRRQAGPHLLISKRSANPSVPR